MEEHKMEEILHSFFQSTQSQLVRFMERDTSHVSTNCYYEMRGDLAVLKANGYRPSITLSFTPLFSLRYKCHITSHTGFDSWHWT